MATQTQASATAQTQATAQAPTAIDPDAELAHCKEELQKIKKDQDARRLKIQFDPTIQIVGHQKRRLPRRLYLVCRRDDFDKRLQLSQNGPIGLDDRKCGWGLIQTW